MPSDQSQNSVFVFLRQRLLDQQSFAKDDLRSVTDWTPNAFRTYWSKQFRPFVVAAPGGRYRVSESFRPYMTWEKFRSHVTQMRPGAGSYERLEYGLVRIFEFYLPLTHEHALKQALDGLFFKDVITPKLLTLDDLNSRFPKTSVDETTESYHERVCTFLQEKFGGYSVYHVDGRFRLMPLANRIDAAQSQIDGYEYLADETTAVTRFILPCESPSEADVVWYFFEKLFINTILQRVNGEAEIWMVEMGMFQRVWVWRVPVTGAADDDEQNGSLLP